MTYTMALGSVYDTGSFSRLVVQLHLMATQVEPSLLNMTRVGLVFLCENILVPSHVHACTDHRF